jgi:thioredoxin-like negative regulator of GroEL
MSSLVLKQENLHGLTERIGDETWVVACLCAAWCDVCTQYHPGFDQIAARHPNALFLWIDIEDCAELVGDFDVENFPTLLIQRGDDVMFYGTTLPDPLIAQRLLTAHVEQSDARRAESRKNAERQHWSAERNLRVALKAIR